MTGGSGASILGGNNNVKSPSSPLLPTSSRDSNTYDTFSKPTFLSQPMPINPNHHQLGNGNLQDRPYRFSFYSNALPATIHARSLSELPAEGQSFEDLFTGRGGAADEESIHQGGNGNGNGGPSSGTATPLSYEGGGGAIPMASAKESLLSRAMGNRNMLPPSVNGDGGGGGNGNGLPKPDDVEASTWWLDVLCPTDDEMKMLSRVSRSFFPLPLSAFPLLILFLPFSRPFRLIRPLTPGFRIFLSQVFGIHPLTTEDIQMEETREKIELFRNYYLVCFRSFDQDPYSQTHLEPLNMYIIVFREGTLSVRSFSIVPFLSSSRLVLTSSSSIPSFPFFSSPLFLPFHSLLSVPLPRNPSPSKRPSPNQAAQGLHRRHVRLDLVRSHRRHHRCVRTAHPEYRVRGR